MDTELVLFHGDVCVYFIDICIGRNIFRVAANSLKVLKVYELFVFIKMYFLEIVAGLCRNMLFPAKGFLWD